jgi:hypothetical protein
MAVSNAEKELWEMYSCLDPRDKSRPPNLTDVFVKTARDFKIGDGEESVQPIIKLFLDAGIKPIQLLGLVNTMRETGAIDPTRASALIQFIPNAPTSK